MYRDSFIPTGLKLWNQLENSLKSTVISSLMPLGTLQAVFPVVRGIGQNAPVLQIPSKVYV